MTAAVGSDPRGRWFRVYARQVRQHEKFRTLSIVELGAWTVLRSEAELRDGALLTDRDDAVLILKRRKTPRPAAVLDRLIALRLFDVLEDGCIAVHDRADNDRSSMESGQQNHRRGHRRSEPAEGCEWCQVERWDRNAGTSGLWVDRGAPVDVDSPQPVERGLPQQAEPADSHSPQPQPQPAESTAGLPGEDDSATAACRMFLNGGKWLSNSEYIAAWDDLDRRYTAEWVAGEIQPAFADLLAKNGKVNPWDLKKVVEWRCAERSRREDKQRERSQSEASKRETEQLRIKAEAATEEEKERAAIVRRAVGLWMKMRPTEPVPIDVKELAAWLDEQEAA